MVRNKKGFSLIELIIAIAILVILTGLLAPQFMQYVEKSRRAKMMSNLENIRVITELAYIDAVESGRFKNTHVDSIIIGRTVGQGEVDQEMQASLKSQLDENELKKISIVIMIEEREQEYGSFENMLINYYPEQGKSNYYYYHKGKYADKISGTFGEFNTKFIRWK